LAAFSPAGVEKQLLSGDLRAFAGSVKGITLPSLTASAHALANLAGAII
jgi:hypothetical protein